MHSFRFAQTLEIKQQPPTRKKNSLTKPRNSCRSCMQKTVSKFRVCTGYDWRNISTHLALFSHRNQFFLTIPVKKLVTNLRGLHSSQRSKVISSEVDPNGERAC